MTEQVGFPEQQLVMSVWTGPLGFHPEVLWYIQLMI